jgi:hypothetical protein
MYLSKRFLEMISWILWLQRVVTLRWQWVPWFNPLATQTRTHPPPAVCTWPRDPAPPLTAQLSPSPPSTSRLALTPAVITYRLDLGVSICVLRKPMSRVIGSNLRRVPMQTIKFTSSWAKVGNYYFRFACIQRSCIHASTSRRIAAKMSNRFLSNFMCSVSIV